MSRVSVATAFWRFLVCRPRCTPPSTSATDRGNKRGQSRSDVISVTSFQNDLVEQQDALDWINQSAFLSITFNFNFNLIKLNASVCGNRGPVVLMVPERDE